MFISFFITVSFMFTCSFMFSVVFPFVFLTTAAAVAVTLAFETFEFFVLPFPL